MHLMLHHYFLLLLAAAARILWYVELQSAA
jgi:hypothetical protein